MPELIAVGDGPHDLADISAAAVRLDTSMIQIFLRHAPRPIRCHSPGQALQFLFAQSGTTLWRSPSPAVGAARAGPAAPPADRQHEDRRVPALLRADHPRLQPYVGREPQVVPARGPEALGRGVILQTARWPVENPVGAGQRRVPSQAHVHDHPEGCDRPEGPAGAHIYGPYLALVAVPLLAVWAFYESFWRRRGGGCLLDRAGQRRDGAGWCSRPP